jgi:hypothetical protein
LWLFIREKPLRDPLRISLHQENALEWIFLWVWAGTVSRAAFPSIKPRIISFRGAG